MQVSFALKYFVEENYTIKTYLISAWIVLLLISVSSFLIFNAYAQQQDGGAATGGSATNGLKVDAQSEFNSNLNNNPNTISDVNNLIDQGNFLIALHMYDAAITYYDKALAIDPNFEDALNGKGVALKNFGNYNEAITYFDKALAIDPNDNMALNGEGLALAGLGNYNEAIPYYDKALAIDPDIKEALVNKGNALAGLGNYNEAIPYYDKALAIDPNYELALYDKNLAFEKLNNNTNPITPNNPSSLQTNSETNHANYINTNYSVSMQYPSNWLKNETQNGYI